MKICRDHRNCTEIILSRRNWFGLYNSPHSCCQTNHTPTVNQAHRSISQAKLFFHLKKNRVFSGMCSLLSKDCVYLTATVHQIDILKTVYQI